MAVFQNLAVQLSANVGQFRSQMASASQSVRSFGAAANAAGAQTGKAFDQANANTKSLKDQMLGLKGAVAGLSAVAAVGFGLKMAADVETSKIAFEGLLGSAERADTFVRRLQKFAAETPFEFPGLAKGAQQFLALGFTTDEAVARLQVIGGAIATTGQLSEEAVGRVTRALAQIQGKGRLAAEELNQLNEVIPSLQRVDVYAKIGEAMKKSTPEVAALAEQGLIPADIALNAIYKTMQDIPGAGEAMAKMSKTLSGLMSTLKDNLRFALADGFDPLAAAIKDTITPFLANLGQVVGSIMGPLGTGLADVFRNLTQVFQTLGPHLPALADAFGSLASAFGELLPPAAQLLSAVLIPFLPVLKALAGLLEGLLGIPGVTVALQGLVAAFAALKIIQFIGTFQLLGGASAVATLGFRNLQVAVGGAATSFASLGAAAGPIGVVLGTLGAALWAYQQAGGKAVEVTADFNEALKLTGTAADAAIAGAAAASLAKSGVVDDLLAIGIPLQDVVNIIRGFTTAEGPEFQAFMARLQGATAGTGVSWLELGTVIGHTGEQFRDQKAVIDQTTVAEGLLGTAGTNAAATQKALGDALEKAFDPITAYTEAVKQYGDSQEDASKKTIDAIHARYDVAKRALDDQERAEKDALDRQTEARRQALDDQLDAEKDALQAFHDEYIDGIEARYEAERDALDRQVRDEREALDDRQRAEKDALDDRLRGIDQEADKRKKAEDRRWEAERDEIQFQIDSTFGAEREGWKARLVELEDTHDVRLDEIDEAADDEKTVLENQLDDQQRAEDDAFDDRIDGLKDFLDDQETAEKESATRTYDDLVAAFEARATQQKNALDLEVTDHKNHLDDKWRDLTQSLTDRENAEVTAAETRRTKAKADYTLSLADYQTYLDDQKEKADQFNADLAVIASRGGADVIAEIAKLPAGLVAQAAKAGTPALTALLESIRAALAAGKDVNAILGIGPSQDIRGVGGINRAAAGRITRSPMISSSPVLWAEAGPEAYIPLSYGRKASATPILAQAASVFGYNLVRMAGGGIIGGSAGAGGVALNMPISIEARVSAGVDPDAVGRAIAAHTRIAVDEALDTLGRQVTMKSWRTR